MPAHANGETDTLSEILNVLLKPSQFADDLHQLPLLYKDADSPCLSDTAECLCRVQLAHA